MDPYDAIIDIESNGLRHRGQQVHCIEAIVRQTGEQLHGADRPGYTPFADMKLLIENARFIIGHNLLGFDVPCLERVLGIVVPRERILDTLVASRVLCADRRELDAAQHPTMPAELVGRHSLDSWGWRLKIPKDAFEHRQDQPWSLALQRHCERDAVVSWALFEFLAEINAEIAA
jgi:DNA polymerase I